MATAHMPFGGGTPSTYRSEPQLSAQSQGIPQGGYAQGYQAQVHREPTPSQPAIGLPQVFGACVSLALIVGVGVWSYKLIMRDVSGVPTVQALEGPMRVAPVNPGGEQADHQGLAVNEVAGRGAAAGPAPQLVLAPTPVDLTDEDAPVADVQLAALNAPGSSAGQTDNAQSTSIVDAVPPAITYPAPELQDAAIQALADQIAAGVKPLSDIGSVDTAPVVTSLSDPTAAATPNEITITRAQRSLRPQARPAQLHLASARAPAPVASPSQDIAPGTLPAGTRLVQLGAYDSRAIAEQEWTRFTARFDGFFNGKRRVIEQTQSGGRTLYRLRAEGFGDLADARRFCAALMAEKTDCIPVAIR